MGYNKLITIRKVDTGIYTVYAPNEVYMGEFIMKEDGYYDFWPEPKAGYWPSYMLRTLADLLDKLNEEWDKIIQEDDSISGKDRNLQDD